MSALIEHLASALPHSFPGPCIDALTANSLRWRTLQNRRSKGEIPESCFIKLSSRKVLILRDEFVAWLAQDMQKASLYKHASKLK